MEEMDKRFEIILNAGNSESASLMSMEASRECRFDEAHQQYDIAAEELRIAHTIQTQLLQAVARGESMEMDILMVHAQDHLTMASLLKEVSKEFMNIYQEIQALKEEKK